ncbi:MAG TPA: hypothetical protein PLV85_09215, partial [Polyangiaceae bacterium]|nr:hypothetical protein [Polyangiaceae bacterium]
GGTITVDGRQQEGGGEPNDGTQATRASGAPGGKHATLRPTASAISEFSEKIGDAAGHNEGGDKAERQIDSDSTVKPAPGKSSAAKTPLPTEPKEKPSRPSKPADLDGEPTTEWTKSQAIREKLSPPSSKPRTSRVSMELGSVFAVPQDEEDVEVPVDEDDSAASPDSEDIHLEPIESVPPAPNRLAPPAPPAPKIKPPPPKPKNLDRPSSGRVDIGAALFRSESLSLDSPVDLFAPVAVPASTMTDELPPSEPPAAPLLSPTPAIAVPQATASSDDIKPASSPASSGRGWWVAVAAAVLLATGGAYFAFGRTTSSEQASLSTSASPPLETQVPALPEPSEKPSDDPAVVKAEPDSPATSAAVPPSSEPEPVAAALPPSGASEPERDSHAMAPAAVTKADSAAATPAPTKTEVAAATPAPTSTPTAAATTKPSTPAAVPTPPPPGEGGGAPFDRAAASASIAALKSAAQSCKQPEGPKGNASVSITFAPSGRVTVATVSGPPFAGTPVGGCIAATFRGASVPPFSGPNVTVRTMVPMF